MNPSKAMRLPHGWAVASYPKMIPGQTAVRMDGECLLPVGGEPFHGPFHPALPVPLHFGASHIEPIEDET